MSDLKPCPFCGGDADIDSSSYGEWVQCEGCGATSIARSWSGDTDIKEEWNKRAQPTIADYLEANKEMIGKTGCKVVTVASLKKFGGLE